MSAQAQLFPGVYFDVVQPQIADSLPRMDIASFVGYASSGPLHTPVAVEDVQRFREIFGKDLILAWDLERNHMERSYLGMSVDAFFRNGGQRCWVVRVADEELAQTATFEIPGLIRSNGLSIEKAVADARSPGSWAEQIKVNTVLQVSQLPFFKDESINDPYLSVSSAAWTANLIASETQIEKGDVISIRPYENTIMYLIVAKINSTPYGIQVGGTQAFLSVEENSDSPVISPSMFDASLAMSVSEGLENTILFSMVNFDTLGVSQDWSTDSSISSPQDTHKEDLFSAQLLHFEILASDNNKTEWRLSSLGFTQTQTRFWGVLPSDKDLFRQTQGRKYKKPPEKTQSLLEEANTPRFPLASPFSSSVEDHEWVYLPIGIPVFPDSLKKSKANFINFENPLILDGIENFGSTIFVDERLAGVGSDLLRREGNSIAYLSESDTQLKGIHSLLTIEEATLVSVPDAIHRRWDNLAPPFDLPIEAPEIIDVFTTEAENEFCIQWTKVDETTAYTLEWSEDPDFIVRTSTQIKGDLLPRVGKPIDLIPEPDTEYFLLLNKKCPRTLYFRVRAENRQDVSVWSNNVARKIPQADFLDCDVSRAETLALILSINSDAIFSPSSPEDSEERYFLELEFDLTIIDESSIDQIEIQKANEFTFVNPEQIFFDAPAEMNVSIDGNLQLFVESQPDSICYYRARGHRSGTKGPWSNTIILWPSRLSQTTLQDKSDFSNTDVLAIHRALLRLCYARGDLFGVLSLPRHYSVQDAQDHFSQLSPTQSYDGALSIVSDSLSANVYPLSIAEKNVCSHAGLYYPWLASQTESVGQGSISIWTIPPDGSVIGEISRKSIEQGAWIAPANTPITDILALETNITSAQWANLMTSRINVIREDSRGFILLSAETLTDNFELKEINVRRLMSLLMRLVLREGNRYVFEPNSAVFQERVQQHFEKIFEGLYSRGAFAGKNTSEAYRVVTDSSVNTVQGVEAGRFIVELHVAPSHALKFIRVRLIQTGPSQLQVQEVG